MSTETTAWAEARMTWSEDSDAGTLSGTGTVTITDDDTSHPPLTVKLDGEPVERLDELLDQALADHGWRRTGEITSYPSQRGAEGHCDVTWVGATLMDVDTVEPIGPATPEQIEASCEAAERDGGAGVILIDRDGAVIPAADKSQPWVGPVRAVYTLG